MKINYNLGTEDLLAFYKLGLKKKSFIFKNYIFGFGVAIAILLSLFDKYIRNSSNLIQSDFTNNFWYLSAYNLVLVTVCIFLVRIIVIQFFRIQMRKKTKYMGDRSLELIKDKVIFSSKNSKTEYSIGTILKLEETRKHYFIYVNEIAAITIPKSSAGSKNFMQIISEKTNFKIKAF